jgi:uncharacterized protein with HEPN domain
MTKQRDPKITIQEIILSCENAIQFIDGMTFELFFKDIKTLSAVQHQILILGEAVKRLSDDIKEKHPNIPWKNIAGTRDILIHCYEEADFEIIWNIVSVQLPKLSPQFKIILSSLT